LKKINKQLRKEAFVTAFLYLVYFAWWYFFAYGLGDRDPAEYKYILGLPQWFFYSCILGFMVISTLLWIFIRIFFKDIDFKQFEKEEDNE
jgi:uncharacterized membrane protein YhdT